MHDVSCQDGYNTDDMAERVLIWFPSGDAPGLRADAAHLALGLAAHRYDVTALGTLGGWRHALRAARVTAHEASLDDERAVLQLLHDYEPSVIHTFGVEAAQRLLPRARMMGANGVATLGHADFARLQPARLRAAVAIFVPCDALREQLTRRLPTVPVHTVGYLVAPAEPVPDAARHALAEEFGLTDTAPLVLHADYFHGDEAETALTLIACAPLLAARVPGVQIVVAGAGPRLRELEARAAAVNAQVGRRLIVLPGHRDDLPRLLRAATVAVGSGRFAAEALAAGVAVVAAGAAGMLGTVTPELLQGAQFACYGRHGRLDALTPHVLASELVGLFRYPDYRERFARDGQAALNTTAERGRRALEIATAYRRSVARTPGGGAPTRILAVLPRDLREMLFTLPALSGIRARYPEADLHALALPSHQALLERLGVVSATAPLPAGAAGWRETLFRVRRFRPDACLSLTHEPYGALVALLSRASFRVALLDGVRAMFFSDHLPARVAATPQRALQLVQGLGVSEPGTIAAITFPPDVREIIDLSLLAAGVDYQEPLVLLCPQAAPHRAWPRAHWEQLMARLVQERPECIALMAHDGDFTIPSGVVPIVPVQDALRLAALLARAVVVITPDSAVLHLSTLVATPAVALYGPTLPEHCALPNTQAMVLRHDDFPCHPCRGAQCGHRRCLSTLTPDEVATCVEAVLTTSRL